VGGRPGRADGGRPRPPGAVFRLWGGGGSLFFGSSTATIASWGVACILFLFFLCGYTATRLAPDC